ncbi:MAG: VCBS repeat-containing protein, partial [Polyangiaceae bacterium]|nr:VCBS repeat-containing protein [Polyangiaceae bacterium]
MSPSHLKLPDGPGSLEGVGENVEPNLTMGLASYGIPIALPGGYRTLSVSLRLAYSSGSGSSVAGMGWSLGVPTIERMTSRGLPRYDTDDVFAGASGEELVRLPDTSTYRARHEGGFVRYTWFDETGDGTSGYWQAEFPDGTVGYFGADATGTSVAAARVAGSGGVFRYHLVEQTDASGHRVRYGYEQATGTAYLTEIEWVFSGDIPRYAVELAYEEREDHLADGRPGVELCMEQRLREILVRSRGRQLRRYQLAYEPYEATGGLTRLARVVTFGTDDVESHPISFSFAYTGVFDPGCGNQSACRDPQLHEMGSVGIDFRTGIADLVDLTGDGLPDVVDTTDGYHLVYLNTLTEDGHGFATPRDSAVATPGSMMLGSPEVQMVDLNGDGFTDLVDGLNDQVLWNKGVGDWERAELVATSLPDFAADADLRFFDYDHDKKIDCVHSDPDSTYYFLNLGDGTYAPEPLLGEPLGWGFSEDGVQMADFNGDGMQDAVLAAPGTVTYRTYLGRGRWGEPREMFGLSPALEPRDMSFVDLNGDSLSDVVVVLGNEVRYALNRNGLDFAPVEVIAEASGGSIPERTSSVSVRFADMNGSGSTDVVWIDSSGLVTYLELVPRRPNLLSRVENGIGKVTEISYRTTAEQMAADGGIEAWTTRVPHPMLMLSALDGYDTLSGVHQRQEFRYANGYFDGREQSFNGFGEVEVALGGDDHVEAGRTLHRFDVGAEDPYKKGLLLEQTVESGGRVLSETTNTYEDCEVAGVPSHTTVPVRFLCQTRTDQVTEEGTGEDEWVTTEQRFAYDGYGNRTRTANLGVTAIGGGGCPACARDASVHGEPCGADCRGDERYEELAFVPLATAGRWLLRLPYRSRAYGVEDSPVYTEELTYYDGEAFVGLPLGEATRGLPTRVTNKVRAGSSDVIAAQRLEYDAHGGEVVLRDANGHDRRLTRDADGLLILAEEAVFDDSGHAAYSLRKEAEYDPVTDQVVSSTAWFRPDDDAAARRVTSYAYDRFGRIVAIAQPGDTLAEPTREFAYELGDPVSRIVTRGRSESGGDLDTETIKCFDGMGRVVQERTLAGGGTYQTNGYQIFNARGQATRRYQAYQGDSGACDRSPPDGVLAVDSYYDAADRIVRSILPDAAIYGDASETRAVYAPLLVIGFDAEDLDEGSPHADTPKRTVTDGQGRLVRIERISAEGDPVVSSFTYDELGRLRSYRDDQGHEKVQEHDLLGRVLRVTDPDTGVTRFDHDAVGNVVRRIDARGVVTSFEYDEADRPTATWDDADPERTRVEQFYDALPEGSDCGRGVCANLAGQLAAVRYPELDDRWALDLFGYDRRGRAAYTAREIAGTRFEFSRSYDNAGRIVGTTLPDGHEFELRYDRSGRLVGVPGYVEAVTYAPRGSIAAIAFANGTRTEYELDPVERVSEQSTRDRDGQDLLALRYERDRVNNLTRIRDDAAPAGEPSADARFTYDSLYRLVAAELDHGTDQAESLEYTYDSIDNLTRKRSTRGADSPAHVGDYVYGDDTGPHQVSRAGDVDYGYDEAGHVVSTRNADYDWDYAGRLVLLRRNGEQAARFAYGAGTTRVAKAEGSSRTYFLAPTFELRDGIATSYLELGGNRAVKVESAAMAAGVLPDLAPAEGADDELTSHPDGAITAADAWLAYANDAGFLTVDVPAAEVDPDVLLTAASRSLLIGNGDLITYVHHDHLGTAGLSTDETGAELQRSTYYPYGELRSSTRHVEDYGYAGQERDASTGLSYLGARYYDSSIGRFTAADPLFATLDADSLERYGEITGYAYAANNPVAMRDETGSFTVARGGGTVNRMSTTSWEVRRYLGYVAQVSVGPAALLYDAVGAVTDSVDPSRGGVDPGTPLGDARQGNLGLGIAWDSAKSLAQDQALEKTGKALFSDSKAGQA